MNGEPTQCPVATGECPRILIASSPVAASLGANGRSNAYASMTTKFVMG